MKTSLTSRSNNTRIINRRENMGSLLLPFLINAIIDEGFEKKRASRI